MLYIFLSIVVATMLVQVPNILGISIKEGFTLIDAAKIAVYTLPLTFTATVLYIYYYTKGFEIFDYPSLMILAQITALLFAFSIQVVFFKYKNINFVEITGLIIAILGANLVIFNKEIYSLINP
jgi:hypothetical protein